MGACWVLAWWSGAEWMGLGWAAIGVAGPCRGIVRNPAVNVHVRRVDGSVGSDIRYSDFEYQPYATKLRFWAQRAE